LTDIKNLPQSSQEKVVVKILKQSVLQKYPGKKLSNLELQFKNSKNPTRVLFNPKIREEKIVFTEEKLDHFLIKSGNNNFQNSKLTVFRNILETNFSILQFYSDYELINFQDNR
jgi:hypothetical protein